MGQKTVAFIIPVFNEQAVIVKTVEKIPEKFLTVCVNDGSRDDTEIELKRTRALVVNHPINIGQGAALQTGIDYALQFPEIGYFVTFDADGQHSIEDALGMLDTIKKTKVDIVVGSSFLGKAHNISLSKKLLLKLAI